MRHIELAVWPPLTPPRHQKHRGWRGGFRGFFSGFSHKNDSPRHPATRPSPPPPPRPCREVLFCEVGRDWLDVSAVGRGWPPSSWPPGHFEKPVARRVLRRMLFDRNDLRFGRAASWPLFPPLWERANRGKGESGTLNSPSRRVAVTPFRCIHCSTAHALELWMGSL
jgi:hypothetical protein